MYPCSLYPFSSLAYLLLIYCLSITSASSFSLPSCPSTCRKIAILRSIFDWSIQIVCLEVMIKDKCECVKRVGKFGKKFSLRGVKHLGPLIRAVSEWIFRPVSMESNLPSRRAIRREHLPDRRKIICASPRRTIMSRRAITPTPSQLNSNFTLSGNIR